MEPSLYERSDTGEERRESQRAPRGWGDVRRWVTEEIRRLEVRMALRGSVRPAERVEGQSTVDLIVVRERLRREVGER